MRGLLVLSILAFVASSFAPAQQAVPPVQPAVAPAPEKAAPAAGSKIWLGRYAEYAEYLRTAPIVKVVDVGQGVTKPRRAFFRSGGIAESALVKPLRPGRRAGFWESYKSEIAAYEMDRLLGLDMVPVTVERRVEGAQASVQLWLKGRLLSQIEEQKPPDQQEWNRQVCRHRVFDALIANIDRNAGNILIDDEWNVILIDHSRAFAANRMPFEKEITRVDRELFEALKALEEETVMERLKPWLFESSIRRLLERRDKLVAKLERLVEEKGEAAVFSF
jgi:hypothetical protein